MNAICTRIGIWSLPLHNMASCLPVLDLKHKILLLIDSFSQCHLVFLTIFGAIDQSFANMVNSEAHMLGLASMYRILRHFCACKGTSIRVTSSAWLINLIVFLPIALFLVSMLIFSAPREALSWFLTIVKRTPLDFITSLLTRYDTWAILFFSRNTIFPKWLSIVAPENILWMKRGQE